MKTVLERIIDPQQPRAHCGLPAEDEVDRLKLAVKDWFRLMEGPK